MLYKTFSFQWKCHMAKVYSGQNIGRMLWVGQCHQDVLWVDIPSMQSYFYFKRNLKRQWNIIVPDMASYIRGWIQMVLTPNDLFSWNNKYSKYTIILLWLYTSTMDSLLIFQLCTSTYSVHAGILKLWRGRLPCPLVVFSFHYVSRLSSSSVRSQLTLPVPAMRIRFPLSQDGAPIHRVRTHSLSRVQHT